MQGAKIDNMRSMLRLIRSGLQIGIFLQDQNYRVWS